jgi:hypothetical protein
MKARKAASLSFLILLIGLGGCGSKRGSDSTPPPPLPSISISPTSVVVTPAEATVYQGTTARFQAQVMGQSNQAVTWRVEQGGLGTIDNTGLYTAPRDASGGPFHVVATSQVVPSANGSAAVTVLVPQVTIAPATVTLAPGGTQTFTATVKGLVDTNVTWTVQEAGGGSVSDAGFYNAPQAPGFYHVVATSVASPDRSGSAMITVTTSSAKFTPTGNMQDGRGFHSATLLANGKVLMAGGATNVLDELCLGGMNSAELYDSVAGSFAPTASMTAPRYAHTATSLPNGEVLITGGFGSGFDCEDLGTPVLSSAEIYDPSNASFKATGDMAAAREAHTATLLPAGEVLVTGGNDETGAGSPTAELYDPALGRFTSTGSMASPRSEHTATLLANGKVLIVGGVASSFSSNPISLAEIYDPATHAFTPTGNMVTARFGHAAIRLSNGRVLIIGGITGTPGARASVFTAELYDSSTGSFSATGATAVARGAHTATLLLNGLVLVAGTGSPTAELYDTASGSFTTTGSMETERSGHSATLLPNGKVLVAGGGSWVRLVTAELYQ